MNFSDYMLIFVSLQY